jgi:hypothetical protein
MRLSSLEMNAMFSLSLKSLLPLLSVPGRRPVSPKRLDVDKTASTIPADDGTASRINVLHRHKERRWDGCEPAACKVNP